MLIKTVKISVKLVTLINFLLSWSKFILLSDVPYKSKYWVTSLLLYITPELIFLSLIFLPVFLSGK
jgi:hypothetical protein